MPAASGRALSRATAFKFCLSVLLCSVSIVVSQAQTSVDGAIRGTILDRTNALLPATTIVVSSPSTSFLRKATPAPDGSFFVSRIPPGDYTVVAELPGFASETISQVIVELGRITTLSINLGFRASASTISVTPQDGLLDTPSPSSVVTQAELQQLPLEDRRWQSLALLTPTANPDQQDDTLLSFRGLAFIQNSTSIDGAGNDQSFNAVPRGASSEPTEEDAAEQQHEPGDVGLNAGARRHSGTSYTFSQQAVHEFRISSQNESALYGHGSGGIITTITRGGSNDLHAAAFYDARSSALAAANPFSIATRYNNGTPTSTLVKPHDLRQQFGGSIGGAALPDRLFYFYAYDQQRRAFPAISSPADPAFYALTTTQRALLANRGVSASKTASALNYLDSLTGTVARATNQTIHFGKLDWHTAGNHQLSAQYNRARSS